MKTIKTSCYLTIMPRYNRGKVVGAKVLKVTTQLPRVPVGYPVIRLRLEIPASVLEPYEALLVIPETELSIIPALIEDEISD